MVHISPSDVCVYACVRACVRVVHDPQALRHVSIAAIGLIHMFNSGGAIRSFRPLSTSKVQVDDDGVSSSNGAAEGCDGVEMQVRGGGVFALYATHPPASCSVDGLAVPVAYNDEDGRVTIDLDFQPGERRMVVQWGQ